MPIRRPTKIKMETIGYIHGENYNIYNGSFLQGNGEERKEILAQLMKRKCKRTCIKGYER